MLSLADSEDLSGTDRADALIGRTPILQGYGPGVLDFPLGPALEAITFHLNYLLLRYDYIEIS